MSFQDLNMTISNIIFHEFQSKPNDIANSNTAYFSECIDLSNRHNKEVYELTKKLMLIHIASKYKCRIEGSKGKMLDLYNKPFVIKTFPDIANKQIYTYLQNEETNVHYFVRTIPVKIRSEPKPTPAETVRWSRWYK